MKKIGTKLYVHKSNISAINKMSPALYCRAKLVCYSHLPDGAYFDVVRVDTKTMEVAYIQSSDWDTAHEPSVGDCWAVKLDGTTKLTKQKGQIYHHKWQFVSEDYGGFDVQESKERSAHWESILPRTREVKCRIGYRKYWNEILKEYGIEQ